MATTSTRLLTSSRVSRDHRPKPTWLLTTGARRANRVSEPPTTNSRKIRMNMPRVGIGGEGVHRGQHAGAHQEGAEQAQREGGDGQQHRPALEHAALFGDRQRVHQRGADQPGHERGVFHRVPEPPAAPAQLVVGPPGAEHDADAEEGPGDDASTAATSAPRPRRDGRRAARRWRRRRPPRSRRSPCRASAGGRSGRSPAAAD